MKVRIIEPTSLPDGTRILERGNCTAIHTKQRPQNLVGMLSQRRRRCARARRAMAILDGRVDDLDGPARPVLQLDDHVPRPRVFVVQGVVDVVDGRVRHAFPLEDVKPLPRRPRHGDGLDRGLELDAVGDARRIRAVSCVRLPLWLAEAVAEDPEEPVIAAAEEHVAVFRLE